MHAAVHQTVLSPSFLAEFAKKLTPEALAQPSEPVEEDAVSRLREALGQSRTEFLDALGRMGRGKIITVFDPHSERVYKAEFIAADDEGRLTVRKFKMNGPSRCRTREEFFAPITGTWSAPFKVWTWDVCHISTETVRAFER